MKGRKISGGKYRSIRKKKLHEMPGKVRQVKLNKEKKKEMRVRGGDIKTVLLAADKVNIIDPKTKKCKRVLIKNVVETPSNRFLSRQNIITKGAIIDTELGKARVTNRPSQESIINAVLIE
jgi:small subunit ribosomal protein S8e